MKIAVAGTGYVGLSNAVLLSQNDPVVTVDIIAEKAAMINERRSPIADEYIEKYLAEKQLSLTATTDGKAAYSDADLIIIATPTNYDEDKNYFDTSSVESVIEEILDVNDHATIVIKSTVPVGTAKKVVDILTRLNFTVTTNGDNITTIAPPYREDVEGYPDLAEEVIAKEQGLQEVYLLLCRCP